MKTCSKCKQSKSIDEFGRTKKRGLLRKICLECERPPSRYSARNGVKRCGSCEEVKSVSEFGITQKKGALTKNCVSCTRARANETHKRWRDLNPDLKGRSAEQWRENNYAKYLEKCRKANKRNRQRKSTAVFDYLRDHPCVDCGEPDLRVLDFDHVRGEKVAAVRTLLSNGASLETIFEEIGKCEVRCANCHRKATIARGGLLDYIDLTS